jgi:2-polyprenyl-6-hydroxyphenyl methylase/3-demethylubiquinone-9 3-methyltransferase
VATADPAETDRLGNAIVSNGGAESACGWCKHKLGVSRQIIAFALTGFGKLSCPKLSMY